MEILSYLYECKISEAGDSFSLRQNVIIVARANFNNARAIACLTFCLLLIDNYSAN